MRQVTSKIPKQCRTCNKEFFVPLYRRDSAKYCSTYCAAEGRKQECETTFWNHALITGPNECWIWQASLDKDGYGQFHKYRKKIHAHRMAYIFTYGDIYKELLVCHNCPTGDNPSCVNPLHLWLGTNKQNMEDCVRKGRRPSPTNKKLTSSQRQEIRILYSSQRYGQIALAKLYCVSQMTIWRVIHHKDHI